MFGRHVAPVALAAALIGAAGSASAQDAQQLQNLQRVIEQQQRQIQAQQQALEDLRRQVEAMQQKSEQAAKTATQAQDAASRAQETAEAARQSAASQHVVTSGEPKVSVELSGQINRMVNVANDGKSTKAYFVDNNNSASRVRFVGKAKVTDDLTIGPYIEVAIQPNPSNKVSQTNETVSDANDVFDARKVEGIAQSKTYGAVYLGKGDPSVKDIARIDLSGTDVLAYANVSNIAGGLLFRTNDDDDLTNTSVANAFTDFDSGRQNRVRYDTPALGGASLSATYGEDQKSSAALRWGGAFAGLKAMAGFGIQDPSSSGVDYVVSGSGTVLHSATGLNLTVAGGVQSQNGDNPYFTYVKGGWQTKIFTFGGTAFSVDWQRTDKEPTSDDTGDFDRPRGGADDRGLRHRDLHRLSLVHPGHRQLAFGRRHLRRHRRHQDEVLMPIVRLLWRRLGSTALLAGAGLVLAACSGFEPIPVKSNNDPIGPGLLSGPSGVFTIPLPSSSDDRKAAKP